MKSGSIVSALLFFVASILLTACAHKAEVKVMSSGSFTAAYKQLAPEFERKTQAYGCEFLRRFNGRRAGFDSESDRAWRAG